MNKFLVVGLVVSLFLVGCGAQELYFCKDGSLGGGQVMSSSKVVYFCPDGTKTIDPGVCRFEKPVSITQDVAEEKAEEYVEAYVQADGWRANLINAYKEDGRYVAQVVVSKRDEDSYESTVIVDGQTGVVTCEDECPYV
jgi:hypothetical protein